MKNYLAVTLLILSTFLMACSKTDRRIEFSERLVRGESIYTNIVGGSVELLDINSSGNWGVVVNRNLTADSYQDMVHGFLSAQMPRARMGLITGTGGNASVQMQGAVRAVINGNTVQNIDYSTARIRVVIWDSLAGTNDSNGKIIPEIPVNILGATPAGGGPYDMIFNDGRYGSISISGATVSGGVFQGNLNYQNLISVDGITRSGTLGYFTIQVCDFFICN